MDNDLSCTLKATNKDDEAFKFTSLLHTYFKIEDVGSCEVSGLPSHCYDKVQDKERTQEMPVRFKGEVDLVFMDSADVTTIKDGKRTIKVAKKNFKDVVVWNPFQKASSMQDLEEGGEKRFICVESGTVWKPLTLKPQETWTASMTITIS